MLKELSENLQNRKSYLVDELNQRSEQVNEAMTATLQKSVFNSLQSWLETHPIVSWLINHPFWTLGILLVLLLLFGGLLRVIGRLTEEIWLIVLRSPFRLVRLLINPIYKITKTSPPKRTSLKFGENDKQEKLTRILLRLEEIKQEQEELLTEMKVILNSTDTRKIKSAAKL